MEVLHWEWNMSVASGKVFWFLGRLGFIHHMLCCFKRFFEDHEWIQWQCAGSDVCLWDFLFKEIICCCFLWIYRTVFCLVYQSELLCCWKRFEKQQFVSCVLETCVFLLFLGNHLLLYSPDLCFECTKGQGQRGSTVFLIILWINI